MKVHVAAAIAAFDTGTIRGERLLSLSAGCDTERHRGIASAERADAGTAKSRGRVEPNLSQDGYGRATS